ncbi:3-hydroxyisobutyrate dehydrogenase [Geodermatophilus bullaregiensis]|uniref:NAD(P)-dependent oxidoreductase n=1 Tax=Geodermatophilus bullaregiensis TaxID=1564160 RepID=UPI00195611B4|nr:NAD(P)-dependent oxidoreductase [Geodermatophilus bullaregiensis]MBM7808841.1 3-hydroxyisobutyrate dehydrogenase [Geodermatophilus bullaregiensis]
MAQPTVAVLGAGTMGAGMVTSLRRAGLPVRVWNRDTVKARALTDTGAEAAATPAEAAAGADVVLTTVLDADAAVDVVTQAAPAAGTTWLQCSTVGVEGADRTVAAARDLDLVLVDCPVLGTKEPAAKGELTLLASGPEEARERLAPVFDALGSTTVWLGEAGAGSRLKLACNSWLFMLTTGAAQAIALTRGLGLDPQRFLDAISGGPVDSPYAHLKGGLMIAGDFPPSFGLSGATKDARLIRAALQGAGVDDRLTAAVLETMEAAGRREDPGAVDMAAVVRGLEQD